MIDRFERKRDGKEKKRKIQKYLVETRVVVGEERSKLTFPRDFVGERWIKGSGELFLFFQACQGGNTRKRGTHEET